jgi:hypothetical protein
VTYPMRAEIRQQSPLASDVLAKPNGSESNGWAERTGECTGVLASPIVCSEVIC